MKIIGGAIYTVDEVSDLLGIPRPTLYRYLREYSIPHLRRSGRISIPEDSFDRIREARDLHKEGLGTESVRRQIREGGADPEELDQRLDRLHETLEDLRGDLREKPASDEVALSPALRTILARQSLMLSAMFNLTGMVEDLLLASGKPRRRLFGELGDGPVAPDLLPGGPSGRRLQISGTVPHEPVRDTDTSVLPAPSRRPARFGSLGRRRRRGVLVALAALLAAVCLAFFLPTLGDAGDRPANETAGTRDPTERASDQGEGPGVETARQDAQRPADDGKDPTGTRAPAEETRDPATPPEPDGGSGIPDVAGKSLEAAARTVSQAGFSVAAIKTEASEAEPGSVIRAEPVGGDAAEPGSRVTLTMSGGPSGASPGAGEAPGQYSE